MPKAAFAALLLGSTFAVPAFAASPDASCPPGMHRAEQGEVAVNPARKAEQGEVGVQASTRKAEQGEVGVQSAARKAEQGEVSVQSAARKAEQGEVSVQSAARKAGAEQQLASSQAPCIR
jgi:hypothetical protein